MTRNVIQALSDWLAEGFGQMAEVAIRQTAAGFELTHFADVTRSDLPVQTEPTAGRALSIYDDAGNFRPLKSAPNLRHGWKLVLPDLASVRIALDGLYPAMLGTFLSHRQGTLFPVPLRETLGRQSGMYAVTKKLTDLQAQTLIGSFCSSQGGCLKTILWPLTPGTPIQSLPPGKFDPAANQLETQTRTLPLLCAEACNLLVAKAREVVKSAPTEP